MFYNLKKILFSATRKEMLLFLLYKVLLDIFYCIHYSLHYAYVAGDPNPNLYKLAVTWIFTAVIIVIVYYISNNTLRFAVTMLIILSAEPTLTVFWVRDANVSDTVQIMIYWIVFCLSAFVLSHSRAGRGRVCLPCIRNNFSVVSILFFWLLISTTYFSYKYGDFRLFVKFSDVYAYRMNKLNSMSGIEAYLYLWNSNLFLPLCMINHLNRKITLFITADVIIGMMIYGIYGNKYVIFQMVLVFAIWAFSHNELWRKTLDGAIIAGINVGIILSYYLREKMFGVWVTAITYRLLFIPAEAHYYYFDFFHNQEKLLLRQSVLRRFFQNSYSEQVSVLIGSNSKYNLTADYNNLNNGLVSDAYANFGVVGVFIYPIVICAILLLYSCLMYKLNTATKNTLIAIYIIQVMGTSLFQTFITGGLLPAMGLLVLINGSRQEQNNPGIMEVERRPAMKSQE